MPAQARPPGEAERAAADLGLLQQSRPGAGGRCFRGGAASAPAEKDGGRGTVCTGTAAEASRVRGCGSGGAGLWLPGSPALAPAAADRRARAGSRGSHAFRRATWAAAARLSSPMMMAAAAAAAEKKASSASAAASILTHGGSRGHRPFKPCSEPPSEATHLNDGAVTLRGASCGVAPRGPLKAVQQ